MQLTEAIGLYLAHRRDRVLPTSLATYQFWLDRWLAWRKQRQLPDSLAAVDQAELQRYLDAMQLAGLEPASRDATWRIWKALFRLLERRGLTSPHHAGLFGPDGLARIRVPVKIRQPYALESIELLIAACECSDHTKMARNRAIILLLWESGCRSSELCSLTDDRVRLDQRRGIIHGKGGDQRWIYWGKRAAGALARYLARRSAAPGALIRSLRRDEPITTGAIRQMLKVVAKRAGVELLPHGPVHNFRRTFAHDALDADVADLDLQQLLGHRSIVSTQTYTRRDPGKLGEIHSGIFL